MQLTVWEQFKAAPDSMEQLCVRLAEGRSLREMARQLDVSYWCLYKWVTETDARRGQYARALDARAEVHRETIEDDVVGDALNMVDVAMRRLRFDALRWTAARLAPKRYGDKIEVDAKVQHDLVGELRSHLQAGSRLPVRRRGVLDNGSTSGEVVSEIPGRDAPVSR